MTWRPLPGPGGRGEPRPVGESLGRIARHLGAPSPAALTELFDRWDELVGPAVAAHARPLRLARRTLVVVVDQPAWAAQLGWLEADLLRRFDERLGAGVVRSVAVRVRPR
jgi:predicted nucleic acid-binding Zn ribbon protein